MSGMRMWTSNIHVHVRRAVVVSGFRFIVQYIGAQQKILLLLKLSCTNFNSACIYITEPRTCIDVMWASAVRLFIWGFSELDRYLDPGQILWEATYLPYLQTIFFSKIQFSKFYDFSVFVNMGRYGGQNVKLYNCTSPRVSVRFQTNVMICYSCHHGEYRVLLVWPSAKN